MSSKRPRVGDTCWKVEWCELIPLDENGDGILDQAKRVVEYFPSEQAAMRRINEVVPLDVFDYVLLMLVSFVPYDEVDVKRYPYAGFWESVGEPKYFSHEDVTCH